MVRLFLSQCALILVLKALWFAAPSAWALPEAARYGHFTCTSCHVSPGGGSTLTMYGREFSLHKLSTWRSWGEENALHGLLPASDRWFLGGNLRWVWMDRRTKDTKFTKFWSMQKDLELGATATMPWSDPIFFTVAGGTKPAGPNTPKEEANKFVARGWMLRMDTLRDRISVRAGLFLPRYGLMLSDHTAFIRTATALGPDSEQTQFETSFISDHVEAIAAVIIKNDGLDREKQSRSGFVAGLSGYIARQRLNFSLMQQSRSDEVSEYTLLTMGLSAVNTITRRIFTMIEGNFIQTKLNVGDLSKVTPSSTTFTSLHAEVHRGVIPFVRYEYWDQELGKLNSSQSRWGGGVTFYPRPHFQTELKLTRTINTASQVPSNQTDLVINYYF